MLRLLLPLICLLSFFSRAQLLTPTNFIAGGQTWNGSLVVTFNWQGATPYGYIFQYSTNRGSTWSVFPQPYGFTTYSDVTISGISSPNNGIPFGQIWSFRVAATDGANLSPYTTPIALLGDQEPQLPAVSSPGISDVVVSFQSGSSTETGFLMERGTNATFTGVTNVYGLPPTNYPAYLAWTNHDSFLPNTVYYYRAAATNGAGTTFWSKTVSIAPNQTPPPATLLQPYTTTTPGTVKVVWYSGGGSINAWLLQRSAGGTNNWLTIDTVIDNASPSYSFTDPSLTPGTTYFYQVIATNGAGFSAPNLIQRITVPTMASGSIWYVDANVPSTSNWSGTSWANAWPNLASVNWAAITPGSTIWVAKGNYNETVLVQVGGSGSNSPVTIHAATNAPYAGLATFQQLNIFQPYVIINGSLSDSFAGVSNNVAGLDALTNNIGFRITSQVLGMNTGVYASSPWGVSVLWCEVGPVGVWSQNAGEGDGGGIYFNGSSIVGSRIAYNWIHDSMFQGFQLNGYNNNGFGDCSVDHNLIDREHANFAAFGGGVDVHDNWGRSFALPQMGHPDGYQFVPGRVRIYNNILQDSLHGRLLYVEMATTNVSDLYIYNNLLTYDSWSPDLGIDFTTEPMNYNQPGPYPWPLMTVSNVFICNNTFANLNSDFLLVNRNSTQVSDLKLKNWLVANNLFASPSGALSQIDFFNAQATNDFNSAEVVFDWNIVGNRGVSYSSSISNITQLPFAHNSSSLPGFSGLTDYHTVSGTVGTNLSAYLLPEINVNLDGTLRTLAWPIGAYPSGPNYQTNDPNLVLWFDFKPPWFGAILDESGHHSSALQINAAQWPSWTNGPSATIPNAAFFNRWYDGSTFGAGNYAAVLNTNSITALTNATICLWAHYFPSTNNNVANDQTATLLSCDPNDMGPQAGNWIFARNFTPFTEFACRTNSSLTSAQPAISFPDSTATGDTGGWHHYAVTFDGTRFIGYFDGLAFATNSLPGVTSLNIGGSPAWLDVGSWPHGYAPNTVGFPNNGWMNGTMADVRIYNRPLQAGEVQALVTGQPIANRPPPPSGLTVIGVGPNSNL